MNCFMLCKFLVGTKALLKRLWKYTVLINITHFYLAVTFKCQEKQYEQLRDLLCLCFCPQNYTTTDVSIS